MACHAILMNNPSVLDTLCKNDSMNNSIFCEHHQNITPNEHKTRWIQKFLRAADGSPFLFSYDEDKKERILRDLSFGDIVLTEQDIQAIPDKDKYIDIYILLFQHGYTGIKTNQHVGLYFRSCFYLTKFLYLGEKSVMQPFTPLARKILDVLVLRDAEHLRNFLRFLPILLKLNMFYGEHLKARILPLTSFLTHLVRSDAARDLSWQVFREDLLKHYITSLGEGHLVTSYLKEVYLPEFQELYQHQKEIQKQKIDSLKEELMAMTWHPDRFQEWCLDEEEKAENRMLFG